MTAESTIRDYYAALSAAEALHPFFHPEETLTKFGISESLAGYDEVTQGLKNQTATTTNWDIASHDLRVTEKEQCAWFSDRVTMHWQSTDTEEPHSYETRWTGTMRLFEREWRFVNMHVSTPRNLSP